MMEAVMTRDADSVLAGNIRSMTKEFGVHPKLITPRQQRSLHENIFLLLPLLLLLLLICRHTILKKLIHFLTHKECPYVKDSNEQNCRKLSEFYFGFFDPFLGVFLGCLGGDVV